jgi:predicted nucleic acid-binding protein
MMRRVTVDTNLFISATLWSGVPRQVIDSFKAKQAILVTSDVRRHSHSYPKLRLII